MSMLEYSKVILEKVSFDKRLLKKEYRKFRVLLSHEDGDELKFWAKENLST